MKDRTLSGATTPGQSGPGRDGDKEAFCIPKTPALVEPHHQIVYCHTRMLAGGVLLLCRDAVIVFCNPSRLGQR